MAWRVGIQATKHLKPPPSEWKKIHQEYGPDMSNKMIKDYAFVAGTFFLGMGAGCSYVTHQELMQRKITPQTYFENMAVFGFLKPLTYSVCWPALIIDMVAKTDRFHRHFIPGYRRPLDLNFDGQNRRVHKYAYTNPSNWWRNFESSSD